MPDVLPLALVVLAFMLPRLGERYVSAIPGRWWPHLSAISAILGMVALASWTPFQALTVSLPKTPIAIVYALVAAAVAAWVFLAAHERETVRSALPVEVSVTQIQGGYNDEDDWSKGKDGNPGLLRRKRITLSRVSITNQSPTDRMSLRFRLTVKLTRKDGEVPFHLDEEVSRPARTPPDMPDALLGPLEIDAQRTRVGSISFYVTPGMELVAGTVSFDSSVGGNTLTVFDLVSRKTKEIKVPTSMGGTVNRLR